MPKAKIAVKAFIVKNEKLLVIKRVSDEVQSPGVWEFPGGRLDEGENPFDGLKREVKEEVGIDIEIKRPLNVQHFSREDGEIITMIIFECSADSKSVILSNEHSKFEWIDLNKAKEKLAPFFHQEVDMYSSFK